MKNLLFSMLFVALALLIPGPSVAAKGPPSKVTITGPGLEAPIDLTDPAILEGFSPWDARFIDWQRGILTSAPPRAPSYDVFFYLQDDVGTFQMIYAVQYVPNAAGEQGYIYLPGPGERWYSMNIGTIIQNGHDGKWHYAAPASEAIIQRLLSQKGGTPPAARSMAVGERPGWFLTIIVLAISVGIGTVILWFRRRTHRRATTP